MADTPENTASNGRPQPRLNPKLDAPKGDNSPDSVTPQSMLTVKDSVDKSEFPNTETFNAGRHTSDDQLQSDNQPLSESSPKLVTPPHTISDIVSESDKVADANNRALIATEYSSTTLMNPILLSTSGKPVTNVNAADNGNRLDSDASDDDNNKEPISDDDLTEKQNGNLIETTDSIPPNTHNFVSDLVSSSTLTPTVKLSPKSSDEPGSITSSSQAVSSTLQSNSVLGDGDENGDGSVATIETTEGKEQLKTTPGVDQNPVSQNVTLPNKIEHGGIPGATGRDQSATDSELLQSTKSPESASLKMTKPGILPTVANTSDSQSHVIVNLTARPANEDDSENVDTATTDADFQNVVSSTDTVAELATSSIKQQLTFTDGLKSSTTRPIHKTDLPEVLPDDTAEGTTQSLILSTAASRVTALSYSESAKSSTTMSTLSIITTSTPATKKGKTHTKSTTISTTLSSTSTKLSTIKESNVPKDQIIEHNRWVYSYTVELPFMPY